ncbi:AAA domain-containing protein [Nocardiopsis alba]|uniref:AAA domain-containing protein n=1 Tax=Nocardiopsis alba TaxID=53437 RepID=UPI0033F7DB1C
MFSCERWRQDFDSGELLVRLSHSRDDWQQATARRHPNGKIHVTTEADLGSAPGNARLREDETRSLRSLLTRIEDRGQRSSPVNTTTAGWIVGQESPRVRYLSHPEKYIAEYADLALNDQQRLGVEQALGSDITFIWGPPGTGKTQVISHIVEGAYRIGERVLFLAPTKVAVDQALERICELLEGEQNFDRGLVQRAGDIEVVSLRERFGSVIDAQMISGRLGEELDERTRELEESLELAREQQTAYERLARIDSETAAARAAEGTATAAASAAQADVSRLDGDLAQVNEAIRVLGTPSGIFARRKATQLSVLTEQQQRLQHGLRDARMRRDTATAKHEQAAARFRTARQELGTALESVRGYPSRPAIDERIRTAEAELEHIHKERARIVESIRARCRIMGTTLAKALQSKPLMDQVDTVIIDEAGMVDLPSAWCAAGLAGKRVVVAGDFRQLPAITKGKGSHKLNADEKRHAAQWMDLDAFHAAGVVDAKGRVTGDPRLVSLGVQYRMRPGICEIVNEVAYPDAPLVTGRSDGSRLPRSPLLESSVVLVDTSARRLLGHGRETHLWNSVHEAVVHELVRGLQYDSVLPARKSREPSSPADLVAVIAPYRKQVTNLRESLKYRFGDEYEGLTDTVHRFQGSQRPLVIVDTVAGAGKQPGHFYAGVGLSSDTTRLLNVALSRAQDHLVVVADVAYLRERLRPDSEAVRMLSALERSAQLLSVDDLIPIRSAGDLSGLSEEELGRPAFFPADEVTKAVEWDIARAEKRIEIYTPFLNVGPVNRWLKTLSPRLGQGVQVIVHTRPPSDSAHKDGERQDRLIRRLREAGCEISLRPRMHEKVAILDDTVLWHGSLNLFASTGPTDLMMRLTDPGACTRVRRIADAAQQDRPLRPRDPWQPPADAEEAPYGPVPEAGKVVNGRLYLNVPIEQKDIAKREVKARWNPQAKLWWVDPATPREKLTRWL